MHSIVEAVQEYALRDPKRPALFFELERLTYGELYEQIEDFARALKNWGLERGDRVALFLSNSPTFVVAYLGTHLAGGTVVLVNTQYREVELSHILNDAGVRLCLTNLEGSQLIRLLAIPTLQALIVVGSWKDRGVDAEPAENRGTQADPHSFADFVVQGKSAKERLALTLPEGTQPAVIGYTSGTTGKAKGALLLHSNLVANIRAVTGAWEWSERDRLLLVLPLFHAHGLMVGLHGTLFCGASVVLREKFEASEVLHTLKTQREISLFFGVPTMYIRLLAEAEKHGPPDHKIRLFVSGSAPLSVQVFTAFQQVFGQSILERYGMTETIMNLTNPYRGERRAGTVGAPFPGQEARIVDVQSRELLPAGEIGEIEVRGPNVFTGYWKRPEATVEAFAPDGWFRTGDLGWVSNDGYYTITGRARELIISGGYNIYPREVEDVLLQHPAIAEAAVIGQPDAEMGEQVMAIVVHHPNHSVEPDELIAFCRERLASYKKPRRVIFVDELPRNALGKVQKHLLSERLQDA